MPPGRLDSLLAAAFTFRRWDARPDAELLARFLDDRDETAFEVLLVRHTPTVRAACRGWLRSSADIDDAAQATFLVLVQRARSIRDRAAVGRWLYRVATNVARRLRQRPPTCPIPAEMLAPVSAGDELRQLLAEEVARLPEKYRLPVQLCYSAGLTTAEAAQRLGWPKGTVLTRLAWARQRLQKNLTRHGVAPAVVTGLLVPAVPAVSGQWVGATVRAVKGILAGEAPARVGVSGRVVLLAEGVMSTMIWDRFKYVAVAALLAVGLVGFGVGQWSAVSAGADDGRAPTSNEAPQRPAAQQQPPTAKDKAPPVATGIKDVAPEAVEAQPGPTGRRREAVIRLPSGTFVKEVDAAPYGSGRLTWTYEEDRVLGLIQGSVMGGEIELATEAEYSLSSTGTIYGIVTSVRVNHLRLPNREEFAQLQPFVGLWPAVEPLVNDVMIDLPFSYQFRIQGERLIISNYRILLAGPNPFGKVGGFVAGEAAAVLLGFQALGTAIEGTYTAADAIEKPAPNRRPLFPKPAGRGTGKTIR